MGYFYDDLDAALRLDNVVVGVHEVIESDGLLGLGLRRVAARVRMSPASCNQHYGGWHQALDLAIRRTGLVRWRQLSGRLATHGLAGYLPEVPDDLVATRVWLALIDVARSRPSTRAEISDIPPLAVLPRDSPLRADEDLVELLLVFGEGIMAALCRPVEPLSTDRARALIHRFEEAFDLPRPSHGEGHPPT